MASGRSGTPTSLAPAKAASIRLTTDTEQHEETKLSLPNLDDIKEIFNQYKTTLDHQSGLKRSATGIYTYCRSLWYASDSNPYIQQDLEVAKATYIDNFILEIATALQAPQPVELFLKILEELQQHFLWVEKAEIYNKSKYGMCLRAIIIYICNSLKENKKFQIHLHEIENALEKCNKEIKEAEANMYDPTKKLDLMEQRKNLLLRLANLGDIASVREAIKLDYINKNLPTPGESFKPITAYDRDFSPVRTWHWDIPWIYQTNFKQIWPLRIKKHAFPKSQAEWEHWKLEAKSTSTESFVSNTLRSGSKPKALANKGGRGKASAKSATEAALTDTPSIKAPPGDPIGAPVDKAGEAADLTTTDPSVDGATLAEDLTSVAPSADSLDGLEEPGQIEIDEDKAGEEVKEHAEDHLISDDDELYNLTDSPRSGTGGKSTASKGARSAPAKTSSATSFTELKRSFAESSSPVGTLSSTTTARLASLSSTTATRKDTLAEEEKDKNQEAKTRGEPKKETKAGESKKENPKVSAKGKQAQPKAGDLTTLSITNSGKYIPKPPAGSPPSAGDETLSVPSLRTT